MLGQDSIHENILIQKKTKKKPTNLWRAAVTLLAPLHNAVATRLLELFAYPWGSPQTGSDAHSEAGLEV